MTRADLLHSRITIVGMGLTGLSCARYFSAKNKSFRVVDSRKQPPLLAEFEKEFPTHEKYCGVFTEGLFDASDILVVSPGMALSEPAIARALKQGAKLTSDIELFLDEVTVPIVAITGSNGKSTVTTLVGEMLVAAGKKTSVAGNIGTPVLEQILDETQYDIFVLELSSFQLERLPNLSASAVTILNVTEDHLDRYESFQDYLAAKQHIFSGAVHVVINRDDALTRPLDTFTNTVSSYGLSSPLAEEFGLIEVNKGEWIAQGQQPLILVSDLKIKGRHNIANAMAAMALCRAMQIDWSPILTTLKNFTGLRHRCEWVGDVAGVSFYNDSKATNVGAAVAAIGGFCDVQGRLLLIAGGLDKDSDFTPMAKVVREKVFRVFLVGQDADKLEQAIGVEMCVRCEDLPAAVNQAYAFASAGDVILLAPACASFDMFRNYEHRGDVFVSAVQRLVK